MDYSTATKTEVNEAVARKLGHELIPHPDTKELRLRENHGEVFYLVPIPDYCGSIAAAWELVERAGLWRLMQAKDKTWRIDVWQAGTWTEAVVSDTAPMAICLAFLKLP